MPGQGIDPEPDRRPDPEDMKAYEHAFAVEESQRGRRSYLQVLENGGRPSDEVDTRTWPDPPTGYRAWVDVYDGPKGKGFVVVYEVQRGIQLFRKQINYGPERQREQDWTRYEVVVS